MFGLFKKKPRSGSFIMVAVKSALVLRATERDNGGLYTPPDVLRTTTNSIAMQMNADLNGDLRELTNACVMELLMEQKFLDRLIGRAMNGSIGTLTEDDENEITRITGKITGIY